MRVHSASAWPSLLALAAFVHAGAVVIPTIAPGTSGNSAQCGLPDGNNLVTCTVTAPASGYFRSAPVFETGAEAHRWLTRVLCVGVGRRTERGVAYSLFVVR